jgi:hypothetical protein
MTMKHTNDPATWSAAKRKQLDRFQRDLRTLGLAEDEDEFYLSSADGFTLEIDFGGPEPEDPYFCAVQVVKPDGSGTGAVFDHPRPALRCVRDLISGRFDSPIAAEGSIGIFYSQLHDDDGNLLDGDGNPLKSAQATT